MSDFLLADLTRDYLENTFPDLTEDEKLTHMH
jgi:hypothetical protein